MNENKTDLLIVNQKVLGRSTRSMKMILRWIHSRIKKNKNAIIIINGETGSGKTYSALSLAEFCGALFETPFSIAGNVSFDFIKLLKKMRLENNDRPGTVFLFEEVGAVGGGASAREWQGQTNRLFNTFMQTSRHRNQILIMTCPFFHNLEKSTRQLCHMQMQMQGINFQNKQGIIKPYRIQVNDKSGKLYFKYLRVNTPDGRARLDKLLVPYPSKFLVSAYESAKNEYTSALNKIMEDSEAKKAVPTSDYERNIKKVIKWKADGVVSRVISERLGKSEKTIWNWLRKHELTD